MPIIRAHSRSLHGPWTDGLALDRYSGSALGTLVHRLKYKSDAGALIPIVDTLHDFIRNRWKVLPFVDCIVPAPPSLDRIGLQPGIEIARAVAARLPVKFIENAVSKVESTPPMKSVFSTCERRQLLRKAIQKGSEDLKNKSVLVIDDVMQSGATLGRISDVLLKESGASEVYALAVVYATNY